MKNSARVKIFASISVFFSLVTLLRNNITFIQFFGYLDNMFLFVLASNIIYYLIILLVGVFLLLDKFSNKLHIAFYTLAGLHFLNLFIHYFENSFGGNGISMNSLVSILINASILVIIGLNIQGKFKEKSQLVYILNITVFTLFAFLQYLFLGSYYYNVLGNIIGLIAIVTIFLAVMFQYSMSNAFDKEIYNTNQPNQEYEDISIGMAIFLSFITFGIYYIYWMYQVGKRIQNMSTNQDDIGIEILLCYIIPFYRIYWMYTKEKEFYIAFNNNPQKNDNSSIYLVLQIFGLELIAMALIQSDLNLLKMSQPFDQIASVYEDEILPIKDDAFSKIEKLSKLKDQGILTDEEFQNKKLELLNQIK